MKKHIIVISRFSMCKETLFTLLPPHLFTRRQVCIPLCQHSWISFLRCGSLGVLSKLSLNPLSQRPTTLRSFIFASGRTCVGNLIISSLPSASVHWNIASSCTYGAVLVESAMFSTCFEGVSLIKYFSCVTIEIAAQVSGH